jgi:hypothetical protein
MKKNRLIIKSLFALFVVLPVTVVFGFLAVVTLFTGIAALSATSGVVNVPLSIGVIAWSVAGFMGMIGLWLWVFMPREAGALWRKVNAAMLAAGALSVVVFVIARDPMMQVFAIVGMVASGIIIAWLLKPGLRGNPDAPPAGE